jgi:PIN domain nuclease of toxin-antitoxin system
MNILIDTQILIWLECLDNSLSEKVRNLLTNAANSIFVPEMCLFEIAIKQKIGKLPNLTWDTTTIVQQILSDGFETMPIKIKHIAAYNAIPLFAEHRDPFDRLLIATAIREYEFVLSSDPKFSLYAPQLQLIENQF